ncbi:MAG: ABC transporter permease [Anaerolineae bacterium]
MNEEFLNTLRSIIANATPLVIASTGETITERAGVINLSLDGSLALSAMLGFAAAWHTDSVLVGIGAAMLAGALIALLIAFANIELRQDQVAVGFVLTLLGGDLARFLGQSYTRIPGPQITKLPIPVLQDIPIIGPVFFEQNLMVYFSYALVLLTWFWLFNTRPGLAHRALGERPETAFARGTRVNAQRYLYTFIGGALVGVAGAAYSLNVKPGIANPPSMLGDGWIALAIVIFGGWHPFRVVLGAYLFALLRAVSADIQRNDLEVFGQQLEFNFVLLNALPWTLMILTLLLVSSGSIERLLQLLPRAMQQRLRTLLRSSPPKALGERFERD